MSDQLEITRTQKLPFKFTGNGFEYFRIWIVNVLFTIITFGIYSAWAKVRTKSYFYRNTKVAGSGFEYHASPTQILKGRLLSFVVYVVFIVATESQLVIASIIAIITVLAMPWLIVRAHVFNARNSSWRNIRFDFNEHSQSDAWMVFLVYPALIPFTLGMIIPYISYRGWRFSVTNSRIGRQPFSFHSVRVGAYYRVFFAMMLPFVMIALLWFVASGGSSLFNLGLAYGNAGQYEEAIASYKEALRIKPDDADAHYNLGYVYRELGQYEEAIASFKKSIRIKPDDANAHYSLGLAYDESGQYEEAIASYKEVLRIKPDDADAHFFLVLAYVNAGQYEEAIASYSGIGFSALMITMIILLALIAVPAYRVMTRNVSLNGVTLGDHTLESTLKVWPVIWIYISNAVAIVFSVGLLIPWARVRVTRYLANHLVLNAADDLESFVRTEAKKAGALGEEAADFMDIDIGGI